MLETATECSMYVSWEGLELLHCAGLDREQETSVVKYNCPVKTMKKNNERIFTEIGKE